MTFWEVVTGQKPLMKPTPRQILDVEQGYEALINSTTPYGQRYKPMPSAGVAEAEYQASTRARASAEARYTLNTTAPVKVADTQGEQKRIFFTVVGVGTTAFVSHNRLRLLNISGGVHEGIPITNAGTGEPALTTLPWEGEMWAVGDTDGMLVDVEMS
jgi:hypothetical protein